MWRLGSGGGDGDVVDASEGVCGGLGERKKSEKRKGGDTAPRGSNLQLRREVGSGPFNAWRVRSPCKNPRQFVLGLLTMGRAEIERGKVRRA